MFTKTSSGFCGYWDTEGVPSIWLHVQVTLCAAIRECGTGAVGVAYKEAEL